jgi:hypothetical protein
VQDEIPPWREFSPGALPQKKTPGENPMKEVKNCPQKTGIEFLWRNEEAFVFHPASVLL